MELFPMPIMMNNEETKNNNITLVPSRIQKAMEFLEMINKKTMERAAVTENNIHTINGTKLTDEEQAAHATACNLLTKYFGGNLPLDQWEQLKIKKMKNRSVRQKNLHAQAMRAIKCPACGVSGDNSCPLCEGKGTLVIISGTGDKFLTVNKKLKKLKR